MDNKITKARINSHLEYDWIKYVALIGAAVLLWSLLYTVFRPVVKEQNRIDFFVVGTSLIAAEQESLTEDLLGILNPEGIDDKSLIKEINFDIVSDDANLGIMLMTRGSDDDFLIAEKDRFLELVKGGAVLEITAAMLNKMPSLTQDLQLAAKNSDEKEGCYGVQLSKLTKSSGLIVQSTYMGVNDSGEPIYEDKEFYIGIMASSNNLGEYCKYPEQEQTFQALERIIQRYL